MLKQIFQTVPLEYFTEATAPYSLTSIDIYGDATPPFIENLEFTRSVFPYPIPTVTAPNSIFTLVEFVQRKFPGYSVQFERFDSITGQFIQRIAASSAAFGGALQLAGVIKSRQDHLYWKNDVGTFITAFTLEATEQDDPTQPDVFTITLGDNLQASHFAGLFAIGGFGDAAIDETSDTYVDGSFQSLKVFKLSTGEFRYEIILPADCVGITLEDDSRCYILCSNRVLVLLDYVAGTILGAVKVPFFTPASSPPVEEDVPLDHLSCAISWDTIFRRLLIFQKVPNNPDGSSATRVLGFRLVPQPVRITVPIPLQVPKNDRTIPVLSIVVGDMNEGVGGYVIASEVTGNGVEVGIPVTDNQARALTMVKCNFIDAPDESPIESPPTTNFTITTTATEPADPVAPVSGVIPPPTPPPDTGGGTVGSPGGGSPGVGHSEADWKAIILAAAVGIALPTSKASSQAAMVTIVGKLKTAGYKVSVIDGNSDHKAWLEGAAWSFISSNGYIPGTFRWDPYVQVGAPSGVAVNNCGIPVNSPDAGSCAG